MTFGIRLSCPLRTEIHVISDDTSINIKNVLVFYLPFFFFVFVPVAVASLIESKLKSSDEDFK